MKKILLLIISCTLLLIGQQVGDEPLDHNEYIRTGLILAIENNRINFEEMWLETASQTQKSQSSVIISDKTGTVLSFYDLEAPCEVELTYEEIDNEFRVSRIVVLEQYHYDDMGFINTDEE